MGTSIFTYRVARDPYEEGWECRHVVSMADSGKEFLRSLDSTSGRFIVPQAVVVLDGTTGHTYSAFETFYRSTLALGTDSFLYKASKAANKIVSAESVGTATGGAGESFALDKKFIDSNTVKVYVAGVEQAAARWSLANNYTAPAISTLADFAAGAVTVDYEFYHQVRFTPASLLGAMARRDESLTVQGVHFIEMAMRAVDPGGHLV